MSGFKKHLQLENLSRYRTEIYGFCALWIMLFHGEDMGYVHLNEISPLLSQLFGFGNIGVDIFLLLSGIGCFFSFKRDDNVDRFYKKRMLRVLPPYLLFATPCLFVLDIVLKDYGFKRFISDLSFYSFWHDEMQVFWYVAFIVLIYLLFPIIYRSLFGKGKCNYLAFFLWIASTIAVNAYCRIYQSELYSNIERAICRFPVFLVGVLFGSFLSEKRNFSVSFYILCFMFTLASRYICTTGFLPGLGSRYTYLFLGIAIAVTLSVLFSLIRVKWIHAFFKFFGRMSLELYIVHIGLRKLFMNSKFYVDYCLKEYLLLLVAAVIIAFAIYRLSERIRVLFERKPKAKQAA